MDRVKALIFFLTVIYIAIFIFAATFEKWFDRYLIRRKKAERCKSHEVDGNWSKYEQQYRECIQKSK